MYVCVYVCMYVFLCLLKRSLEICFDQRAEECTGIVCRLTGGKLVSSGQSRAINTTDVHAASKY